jgi:hypothetical protein
MVDLPGLSCRWDALRSPHGKMLTLIVPGGPDPGEGDAAALRLAAQGGDPRAARVANLRARWPPLRKLLVLAETLLARWVIARNRPVGTFDPHRYREEVSTHTDFCRHGMDVADTACMTCLVSSTDDGLRLHVVDGGNGGHTNATRKLKSQARRAGAGTATAA